MSQFLSKKHVLYNHHYFTRMDHFSQTEKYRRELDRVIRLLQPQEGDLILDLGCNTGNPAAYVVQATGCRVVGLDFPAAVLPFWRGTKRPFVQGDGHRLPFAAHAFAHAYVMHTIGHVLCPPVVLSELRRLLRPGGRLALVTPNRWFVWAMKPLNYLRIIKHNPDPTVLRYYTLGSLCRELETCGFTIIQAFTYGALPNLLTFLDGHNLAATFRERIIVAAQVG